MTREELDLHHVAALTRHYRTWTDNAGQAPRGLLDDLARIADEHAASVLAEPGLVPPPSELSARLAEALGAPEAPAQTPGTSAPARTAARRPAARRGAK